MKTKNQKKKKNYVPPEVIHITIDMEQGIATGSAQVTPGDTGGTPAVEDFVESKDEQFWNF